MVSKIPRKLTKRVTEYYEDPLNGESVYEYFTDPKQDEPKYVTDKFSEDTKSEIRADEVTEDSWILMPTESRIEALKKSGFDVPSFAERDWNDLPSETQLNLGYVNKANEQEDPVYHWRCSDCGADVYSAEEPESFGPNEHKWEKVGVTNYVSSDVDESLKQIQWTTESCGCKVKATEAKIFEVFVAQQIKVLQKKATESQSVDLLLGKPNINGQKIEGTLAYAGVSLNNRLYLPEELAKGDGMTLPLIINHASIEGAEQELYQEQRVPPEIVKALERGEEINVGFIKLSWDADKNVLFYTGTIEDPFWIKEAGKGDMAVSLGMYYDADSPQYCPSGTCYTIIKNGEFHEVSLVWHPGFAISTMEAVEVALKKKAMEVLHNIQEDEYHKVTGKSVENIVFDEAKERKPMNADNPSTITKVSKNKTIITPPEDDEDADEAVGPHSREYDYIINEPTTTPEITGSNATQYSKPPSTRVANARMNQNMVPSDLSPDDKKYLKHTEFD